MNKFFTIIFIATAVISSATRASENNKTEGDYLGLGLVGVKASFTERYVNVITKRPVNIYPSYSNKGLGLGVSYKHAFNFNKFFIAPGIFFDQLETRVNGANGDYYEFQNDHRSLLRLDLKNRYGLKTDFGYDLNNYLSPYLTVGYTMVNYRTQNYYYDFSSPDVSTIRNGSVKDFVYGAGLKINYNSDLALNIEYINQSFLAKTYIPANPYQVSSLYKVNLQTLSLGITHKF